MILKESILGVKCEFSENQEETCDDETVVLINGNKVVVKKNHLKLMENSEKLAVLGENPWFIKTSGIIDIIGPSRKREYWLRINSRGYLKEFFVKEEDLIL